MFIWLIKFKLLRLYISAWDTQIMDPVVSISWLKDRIGSTDLKIVDCRWNLDEESYGYESYLLGHIPGAVFLDVEKDLSDKSITGMGRHPFPSKPRLEKTLEKVGISEKDTVVAYDDSASGSARLWFLLKYYSFDRVFVLDGGFSAWVASDGDLTTEITEVSRSTCSLGRERDEMLVDIEQIEKDGDNYYLVDARAHDRYSEETEPIDPLKGHIPGADNVFYEKLLNPNTSYRPASETMRLFNTGGKQPVIYCGSGILACVTYIAMLRAGVNPKMFPGGWTQWYSHMKNV